MMDRLSQLWRRLFFYLRRDRFDRELEEEMRFHLELKARENAEVGMKLEEARFAAQRQFGNKTLLWEVSRDMWSFRHLETVAQDLRFSLRMMGKNPGFTAVAVLTLALGIGANTAMFSAVDAVLIRPLPFFDASRLVMIWDDTGQIGESKYFSSPAEWSEWRRHNTVFTDIAASQPENLTISGDGEPEELPGRKVTANLWTVLGVKPLLGRVFTEEEDAGGERVAVISYSLWQRRFGALPDVLGRKIMLNDRPYEVIGVMPREFYFMPSRDIDLWIPTSFSARMLRHFSWHDVHCVARLKPGVTLQQAGESMAALNRNISITAGLNPRRSASVTSLRDELTGKAQASLIALLCASSAVLLIACVNLANLLMSRGTVRRREVAIRAALGAGRGRLIRQFLIESLALAGLGALAGLALAIPAMRFLETLVPETMAATRLTLDWRVLAFSAGITIAAGLAFGLMPALAAARLALHEGLRDGGRGSSGARSHWLQHSLIVIETALAVVLLTAGSLLLQTFQHLRGLDLGIQTDRVLTFVTPLFRYPDFDKRVAFVNAQLEQVRAIPGVASAAAISRIPLTVNDNQAAFYRLADQSFDQVRQQVALTRVVTRDYFTTIGARLREGRFFNASDQKSESPAAVVNESFANRNYPGRSPLGARFQFQSIGDNAYWYTIVGVVNEIRDRGVAEDLTAAVYRVHEQADQSVDQPSAIVVRTSVDPGSIVSAVRQAIWSVDKNQPVARVQTFDEIMARQLSIPSQNTTLLSAFALLALLLASLGLYGVLSYAVMQRASEIGVRMALGATARDILLSFCRRGLILTLAGLAIGLVLSAISARFMTALLYGFQPDYLSSVAVVSLILLAVAALACFIPARRAANVDPLVVLRNE
jgi:predicted permease